MCGIFGIINKNGNQIYPEKVIAARDTMIHRGPDDEGLYINHKGNVALAHRRLSIIELSPLGHQPMTTEDGRYTITFNGEIYNYKSLQSHIIANYAQLPSTYNLKSNSDTEALLKLYALEGDKCLLRLRGMYSFSIWDDKEKTLFAARDRFGIKPFYYLNDPKQFIFSSELKAIKCYDKNLTVSNQGIDAFLKTGSIPAPLTIYNEINSLSPGHYLKLDSKGKIKIERYWHFADLLKLGVNGRESGEKYNNTAKEIIKNALLDTLNAHLVSDVEVGAFLSGGIDSTSIISLMRQLKHDKIKTISVIFPGNQLDESKFSQLAAKQYKTEHYEYPIHEKELFDDFEEILCAMDQPTIDGINTYFVSKAAKSFGLKVVMSGLGGDELFGGYPTFRSIPKINNYLKIKNSLPFGNSILGLTGKLIKSKVPAKVDEFLSNPDSTNAGYKLYRGLFTNKELKMLGWNYTYEHPFDSDSNSQSDNNRNFEMTSPQFVSYLESTFYMANQLLRDSDVFSMAHSLELRVPFVDHLLYSTVLPYLDEGNNQENNKQILIDGVHDLSDTIVNRPKMGFTFPFADWMSGSKLNDKIQEAFKNLEGKEIFSKSSLNKYFKNFESNNIHWSRIWTLFILDSFSG